jgi:hypothetical protein
MRWVKQIRFAELAGVSRAAVSKAVKAGKLVYDKKMGINIDHPVNLDYLHSENESRTRKQRGKTEKANEPEKPKPKPKSTTKSKPRPKKLPPASDKALSEEEFSDMTEYEQMEMYDQIDLNGPSHLISKVDADRLKTIEMAREKQIKREQLRGELVNRDFVARTLGMIYKIDTGQLRPLGDTLAPELAAICGVEDEEIERLMAEFIEKKIFESLEHIKRLINDALEKIGSEEIGDE